jgi:hypothetical protein
MKLFFTKKDCKRLNRIFLSKISIVFLTILIFKTGLAQTGHSDYSVVFKEHYFDALDFLKDNPNLFDTLEKYNFNPRFAISIIFPELMRYSNLRDVIETSNLKVLYIQFGKLYADFSIGRFQMKPSFIEKLEKDYNVFLYLNKEKKFLIPWFDINDINNVRSKRVVRMSDMNWQIKYLMLFIFIMDHRFKDKDWKNDIEKLKFYSTAYNYGYINTVDKIMEVSEKNFFKIGLLDTDTYNYSDIAIYYYMTCNK